MAKIDAIPQLLPMHLTEVVRTDRYRIVDPLSRLYIYSKYDAEVHVWAFESLLPTNPRTFLYVTYGNRPGFEPVEQVFGADPRPEALEMAIAKTRDKLRVGHDAKYAVIAVGRMHWNDFLVKAVTHPSRLVLHQILHEPWEERSIETMLQFMAKLGNLIDGAAAYAISILSHASLAPDGMQVLPGLCSLVGRLCRSGEMEGVYWRTDLLTEALRDHELFVDTPVLEHFIPDGPQLWYFDEPVDYAIGGLASVDAWWDPSWRLSAVALIPGRCFNTDGAIAVYIFEKDIADPADAYEMMPRIVKSYTLIAGDTCRPSCSFLLAGMDFIQDVLVKQPAEHKPGALKEAARQGRPLPKYSVLTVRRVVHTATIEDADGAEGAGGNYHFSFFQRRHRRRLNAPRKSDGVQVITVAACQKCKHLPLRPGSDVKVTKVTR